MHIKQFMQFSPVLQCFRPVEQLHLEDDVLLCIALLIIVGLLIAAGIIWQAMCAAGWVPAVPDRT
jgi:hypothetical protein